MGVISEDAEEMFNDIDAKEQQCKEIMRFFKAQMNKFDVLGLVAAGIMRVFKREKGSFLLIPCFFAYKQLYLFYLELYISIKRDAKGRLALKFSHWEYFKKQKKYEILLKDIK
jgi:hypothetical protein